MSSSLRSRVAASLTLMALIVLAQPNTASAATSSPGNSVRVMSAISQVQLSPGQANASISEAVTNLTNGPLAIQLNARDFGALNQAGAISFYGPAYVPAHNPHGLQQAIAFSSPTFLLSPHQTKQITVSVQHTNTLAAGGHYGAILFSPQSIALAKSGGASHVNIQSSVASLVFLVTASGGTQHVTLSPLRVSPLSLDLPTTTNVVLNNTGNTQTTPRGQLTLFGPGSHILSTLVMNNASGMILPGASRLFELSLPLQGHRFAMPGFYRLELQYRADNATTFQVVNKRILYLNPDIVLPAIVIIIAAIYVVQRYGRVLLHAALQLRLRR
jgi:hypothetical protein